MLSKADLTYVYPLNSMGYVFVVLLSALLLHEALTPYKLMGAVVIMAGIIIMHQ
ncbi:4-amino-4-deoxy-L-arabinose-phosphoundecaprenol flippase subunit ArnE [compost metagenome]